MMDPIERFWRFWTENRASIERAIHEGTLVDWVERVGAHVRSIDPKLDWEFGRGIRAQHYFCLSGKGDPEKRLIAERWRAQGPPDDGVFEYCAARPGGGFHPGLPIRFGEHDVIGDDFEFEINVDSPRRRVDLAVWHPEFATMPDTLPITATFIWLDSVFGEDDVERYVGRVEIAATQASRPASFPMLVDAVGALSKSPETFTLLQGELDDGSPCFVTVNLGLKRIDHLLMTLHIEVSLELTDPTEHGLTTAQEAERLNAAEDELTSALGPDAVFIGRETAGGRRVLHFHAASGGPALGRIDAWAAGQPWSIDVRSTLDPQWKVLDAW